MVSRGVGSNRFLVQSAKIVPRIGEEEFPQLFDPKLVSKAPGTAPKGVGGCQLRENESNLTLRAS